MSPKTIAILNRFETTTDPRVRRFARSFVANGHRVIVFGLKGESTVEEEEFEGYRLVRCDRPSDLFAANTLLESLSPTAAQIVRAADPSVMELDRDLHRFGPKRIARALRARVERTHRRADRLARKLAGREVRILIPQQTRVGALRSIQAAIAQNVTLALRALRHAPDVIHANDLDTLLAGFVLKDLLGVPLVYDAHEVYAEQFPSHMRDDLWHRFYVNLERTLLEATDGRITVCDSIGDYFPQVYGCGPVLTVRNVPSISMLPDESILCRRNEPRVILYHGMFFRYRGLDEIIAAVKQVEGARFVFRGLGYHEAELRRLVTARSVADRVEFAPPVGVGELVQRAAPADIGLNPFVANSLNTQFALPNKLFEYMMAGLALANSDLVEMRRLTRELDNGVLFDDLAPDHIAATLNGLIADHERLDAFRERSYRAARDRFHWEEEEVRLMEYYRAFV